jgi:leader peptidase (prepilin peptidase)/N-methyltransferase
MGIAIALVGLAVGSFLNVCIDRLPAGQSLFRPRSRCPACKTELAPRDLIPVISYVFLRGRCRYCAAPIPARVPLVEAGTGLLFFILWWRYGLSTQLALAIFAACVLIVFTGIAAKHLPIMGRVRRICHDSRDRE